MDTLIQFVHALAVAILVGKVVLLSFVVAPILAKNLDREPFGKVVRQLFPAYYGLGMGTAVAGFIAVNGLVAIHGGGARLFIAGGLWILVLVTEAYCRSTVTPQSNAIRDWLKEQESREAVDPVLRAAWHRLHQRSVYLNSSVLLAGCALIALIR
ncbi:MAG: DUF4149 domain-containing protein [Nitrospira sp.]